MAYLLITPTVRETPAGGGRLFMRYSIPRGVSLLVSPSGAVSEVRFPSEEQLADARVAYIGGHEYVLEDDEAQIIADGGYGEYLHPWDGYTEHYQAKF